MNGSDSFNKVVKSGMADSDRLVDWQRLTFPVDIIRTPARKVKNDIPAADTDLARLHHGLQFIT